jgi:hypothetical protein
MKPIRWLLFLPLSVAGALATFIVTTCDASYLGLRWPLIVNTIIGLTPMIGQNFATMFVFVALASWIAPSKKKVVAAFAALLGPFFTLPISRSQIEIVLPAVSWCSRAVGGIMAVLVVFYFVDRANKSNKAPLPTPTSVTPAAAAPGAPPAGPAER